MDAKYKKADSIAEFIDAIRIRVEVFIKEQGSEAGWEPDEKDKDATHFIAIVKGNIVSTARLLETAKQEFKIERMATLKGYRKKGVTRGLVGFVVKEAVKKKPKRIWMQAQVQAKGFYEKCGFKAVSMAYDLYGIQHLDMEYRFR